MSRIRKLSCVGGRPTAIGTTNAAQVVSLLLLFLIICVVTYQPSLAQLYETGNSVANELMHGAILINFPHVD